MTIYPINGAAVWRPGSALDEGVVATLRERVARKLAERQAGRQGGRLPRLGRDDEEQLALQLIGDELRALADERIERGRRPLGEPEEQAVGKAVFDILFRLGRLQPYLEHPRIKNLHAQGGKPVWLEMLDGTRVQGAPLADSPEELIEWVRELGRRVSLSERRFDPDSYRINLQLPDGSRLFAIAWVTPEPEVWVRRHHFIDVGVDDLGHNSEMVRSFLSAMVRAHANVVIAGDQGAGKTTMLRAMAAAIDREESIVTIETDLELGLDGLPHRHHEVTVLEAREANIEGVGRVTCAQLVADAMRMNAEHVFVGEVRSDEATTMLNAMSSGANGSMCTLHAKSSDDVFARLGILAAQSPERLDQATTDRLACKAIDFIVYVDRDADGVPALVSSIREVTGYDDGPLTNELFSPGPDRRAYPTGVPVSDRRQAAIAAAGFDPAWLLAQGALR